MLNIFRSTGLEVPKDIYIILLQHKDNRPNLKMENGSYLNLGIYNIV